MCQDVSRQAEPTFRGVDYLARNQDQEDEEKLLNALDITRIRRFAIGYHQADRANREGESMDEIGQCL